MTTDLTAAIDHYTDEAMRDLDCKPWLIPMRDPVGTQARPGGRRRRRGDQDQGGIRDHPGLKHEIACRAFLVRTLSRLGLDLEPVRGIGRPPGR